MDEKRKGRDRIVAALRSYVDLGLPVIPLCSYNHEGQSEKHIIKCKAPGKKPLIKGWREHQETTREQVNLWLREFRYINIGLPLGKVSGYVGIDVDGEVGEALLEEMSQGDLPDTWEYTTGAGRRLLYAIPVGMETKKHVNFGDGEHEECSILADGQQTVLPPSVHKSGRVYEWLEGHSPDDMDCSLAPSWLIELVRADRPRKGTINLNDPNPQYEAPEAENAVVVNPIVVADSVLPSEFSDYDDLELVVEIPDTSFTGKAVKVQDEEENLVTEEELLQKIPAGNRDNAMTRIIGSFCARFRALGKDYIMFMAKNHNQMFCDPPLDDFAIESKVNHFWEAEQLKSAQFKKGGEETKPTFAPVHLAQVALNLLESRGYCVKVDAEHPIIWLTKKEQGPWVPFSVQNGTFQALLRDAMADPKYGGRPEWTTTRHYKDVAHSFAIELRTSGRVWKTHTGNLDTQTLDAYKYIPLAGGKLLEWRTGELHPWDPETNLTYVLPIEYDPLAKAPNWERRLKEWLPDEGSRNILQEFIGYSLIPYMGFEKALVIQGEGANGKSLFLETIQHVLGYDVVDSINMGVLFSRFGQASLLGKILNIVNEAGSDYLRGSSADLFKNLVSGGRIKADVKNQAPITFNNTAKFIFASNHDIKTGDKSEGWLRRMLIVPFEQDFRNSDVPKYQIMEELKAESAGIFNWALEGLKRLLINKQFSESESANRKKAAYIRENDIAADFFMNCLETFDLTSVSENGKAVRAGIPSGLVNLLFSEWIEYRESSVTRKVENITKYLERKHALSKARTTHTLHVNKVMTECWIGLRMNIRDAGFLEHLLSIPYSKYPELKQYAEKRLAEIDAANGYIEAGNKAQVIQEFPDSKAT